MKKKILIIYFLIFGFILPLKADEPTVILGTSFLNQAPFVIGSIFCQMANFKKVGFQCLVQRTDGAIANIWNLKNGLIDIAFVDKKTAESIYKGQERKIGPLISLRLIMPIYKNQFIVIANPKSNIGTFNDLKGKKIDIGLRESKSFKVFEDIMKVKGWTDKDFEKIYESEPYAQKNNLLDNKVDAIVLFERSPNLWIFGILEAYPGRIISLDAEDLANLNQMFPDYSPITLDAKMYPHNNYVVQTFGTEVYLLTTESTDSGVIYSFLKMLDQNMYELKKTDPALKDVYTYNIKKENSVIPLHLGAKQYFLERGIL